ncbi:hypothetical protein HDV04_000920 [Boothiomyces sp. JEL0838]|nr:hypothetical protein HDV04_000871 [Boothiomyces sp. JEL0838]KAJ3314197.1 hypothetical protein HDV04_000920 [Boothiomyces sp. JEL0838]
MLNGKNLVICRRLKKRVENKPLITAIPQTCLSEVGQSTAQHLTDLRNLKQGYKLFKTSEQDSNADKANARLLAIDYQQLQDGSGEKEQEGYSDSEDEKHYIRPDSAVADLDKKQEPAESPKSDSPLSTRAVLEEIDAAIDLLEKQLNIGLESSHVETKDVENEPVVDRQEDAVSDTSKCLPRQNPIEPSVDPIQVQKSMLENMNHRRLSTDSIFSSVTTSSITTSVSKVNPIVEEIKYGISCISYNVPNFVNLNITMCYLTLDQQTTLSNSLATNTFLKSLTISFAGIQTKSGIMFAKALMKNHSVEYVDFQGNSLGNQAVMEFAVLLSRNDTIENLNLSNQKNVSPIGLDTEFEFVNSLKKNHTVKKLHLTIRNSSYRNSIEKSLMDNSFHRK